MVEYYQKNWGGGDSHGNFLYEVKDANKDKIGRKVTGTYVPKELILDIASWVSIEFYDKCNRIVVNYFVEETRSKMEHLQIELEAKDIELKAKADQLKANEEHILLLKDMLVDDQKRDKTQVIYIATSQNYARQNRFKIGGVESTDKLASTPEGGLQQSLGRGRRVVLLGYVPGRRLQTDRVPFKGLGGTISGQEEQRDLRDALHQHQVHCGLLMSPLL